MVTNSLNTIETKALSLFVGRKSAAGRWAICLLLCFLGVPVAADNGKADALIAQFDASDGAVGPANRFFAFLDGENFTDGKIVLAKGMHADSVRQKVWYWAAEWYNDVQNYQRAQAYALKALPLYRHANADKADCLNLLGIVNVRLGNMSVAADYAKQCVDIDIRLGNPDRISSGLNTLAGIYMAGDQAKEAEHYILQALQYAGKADNPTRKAVLLGMASEVYHKLNDDIRSLSYASQAFALDSVGGNEGKMAIRLTQMASALAGQKRYSEAESTYRRALIMLRRTGNAHSEGIAINQLGFVLAKDNRHEEAVACFRQASAIFARMGDLYNDVHSHKGLYESLWTVNPDSARIALETYHTLKDSLYHQVSASALARYNAEFGADRLQEEVEEHRHAHRRTSLLAVGGGNFSPLRVLLYAKAFQAQIQEDAGIHQDGGASPAVGGCFR